MTAKNLYEAISEISPEYIEEADTCLIKKRNLWKRFAIAAACIVLCFSVSVSVLASNDNSTAYEILYAVTPELAQKLKPIRESCEDNGIKMEVVAANLEGNAVNILLSMQDTMGSRITESSDLMDSYSIHTPYDQSAGCQMAEFNSETATAFWMLNIDQSECKLKVGDKITFSVNEFLSKKEHAEIKLDLVDIANIRQVGDFIINPHIRGYGGNLDGIDVENTNLLFPNGERCLICEGISFTGAGIVDDKLHVQVKYGDIPNTDNHGYIYLKSKAGEIRKCDYDVAFWADNNTDSYNEYIFDISTDELDDYELWGEFWTCNNGPILGEWQVTFPITQ